MGRAKFSHKRLKSHPRVNVVVGAARRINRSNNNNTAIPVVVRPGWLRAVINYRLASKKKCISYRFNMTNINRRVNRVQCGPDDATVLIYIRNRTLRKIKSLWIGSVPSRDNSVFSFYFLSFFFLILSVLISNTTRLLDAFFYSTLRFFFHFPLI